MKIIILIIRTFLIIYLGFVFRYHYNTSDCVLFTYKQLESFALLDKLEFHYYQGITLKNDDYDYESVYVGLYFYFDYLRLKWLVNYNKRKIEKAKVLQKMQKIINKQYEEIEKEVGQKW